MKSLKMIITLKNKIKQKVMMVIIYCEKKIIIARKFGLRNENQNIMI